MGLFSTRRQLAAAASIVAVPLAFMVQRLIGNELPPNVTLAIGTVGSDSIATIYRIPIRASQLAVGSIVSAGVGRPTWRLHADPTSGALVRRPDHKGWTLERVATDSGGIDLFDVADDGREQRLTDAVGDDEGGRWSPDGRRFVFHTARWNRQSHYDLAMLDPRSGAVDSLTRTDDSDSAPLWSSDGSRIAFGRVYWDGRPGATCVIDVDGRNERCFSIPGSSVAPLDAWYDASHVIVRFTHDARAALGRLDLGSGVVDTLLTLGQREAARISEDGRWVICQCHRVGYAATAVLLFPIDNPNRVIEIDVKALKPGRRIITFESATRRARYAERLVVGTGLGPPLVGVPHLLAAKGITPDGDTIALGSVRWSSSDTTVATVDSTGIIVAKQAGIAHVVVTAGGWRTAWRELVVRPRETLVLLREDWFNALDRNWRAFGQPLPRIDVAADGTPALLNNGDGSFTSGVYSLTRYPTTNGLAVDAWISSRITSDQWQIVAVSLEDGLADAVLKVWDHGGGNIPRREANVPSCNVGYPTSEGRAYGDSIAASLDRQPSPPRMMSAPRSFRAGAWFHVRLQIFPDGRCGVAVNGVPIGRSSSAAIADTADRVLIFGNSVGTKVLVGPVVIRAGVPDDIDWSLVSASLPESPPRGWSPRRGP